MNRVANVMFFAGALLSFGCSSKLVVSEQAGTSVVCDQGREAKLVVFPEKFMGMHRARANPHDGYYLFDSASFAMSVTGVDHHGGKSGEFPIYSMLGPTPFDLVPIASGGSIISGTVDGFSGPTPWVGEVDANWNLIWERDLKSPQCGGTELARLSDESVIVAALCGDSSSSGPTSVFWARITVAGDVLWKRSLSVPGLQSSYGWAGSMLSTTPDDGVRIVVATAHGVMLVQGDGDGLETHQLLDTTLTGAITDSVGLPDGHLVIASFRASGAVLTMLAPSGAVEWEKLYAQGEDALANAVAFNAGRNELLLGGEYRGTDHGTVRTWMIATDLGGNQLWQLVRAPMAMDIDGNVSSSSDTRGPGITDIAPQPDGSFLATGETSNLSYFVVGAEPCGG